MRERFSPKVVDVVVPANRLEGRPNDARGTLIIPEPGEPGVLALLGVAQDGLIPHWAAEKTEGIDVAGALPHWDIPADEPAVRSLALRYPQAVLDTWREVHENEDLVANTVAESQAAIGVMFAESKSPEDFGNIALLRPLGFSVEQMGSTPGARVRTLARRAFQTLAQADQLVDPRGPYIGSRLLRRLNSKTGKQVAIGLSEDIIPLVTKRVDERSQADKKTVIFSGGADRLILPSELEAAQRKVNGSLCRSALELIVIEGASHRSLATDRGARDLQQAADYIRAA